MPEHQTALEPVPAVETDREQAGWAEGTIPARTIPAGKTPAHLPAVEGATAVERVTVAAKDLGSWLAPSEVLRMDPVRCCSFALSVGESPFSPPHKSSTTGDTRLLRAR